MEQGDRKTPLLSIIIPTYNEEENIGALIEHLNKKNKNNIEIIIADANSTDATIEIARAKNVITVTTADKGRATQMNCGASIATAGILYFVHADTLPPEDFLNNILEAVDEGYNFGRYKTKFKSNKILLKINEWFTKFDWFICYGGDQTLFITKKLFNEIGGFNSFMKIMEDYDIVSRAKKTGRYKILNNHALVSARKYETNSWLAILLANRKIVKMYKKGAGQNDMINKYRELIKYR